MSESHFFIPSTIPRRSPVSPQPRSHQIISEKRGKTLPTARPLFCMCALLALLLPKVQLSSSSNGSSSSRYLLQTRPDSSGRRRESLNEPRANLIKGFTAATAAAADFFFAFARVVQFFSLLDGKCIKRAFSSAAQSQPTELEEKRSKTDTRRRLRRRWLAGWLESQSH